MKQIKPDIKRLLEDIVNYKICPFTLPMSHMRTSQAFGHPMLVFVCGVSYGTARGGEQGGIAINNEALTPCSIKYASDCELYRIGMSRLDKDVLGLE